MAETLREAVEGRIAPANPFDKGRPWRAVMDDIVERTGDDYPLFGLLCELEAAVTHQAAALARSESPSPEGLDVERLVRSDRFRQAVRDVFMAPGEWGPAQGYYAESIELFIDALAARLAEESDDG